ncbi:hypothetical protein MUP77_00410 [Candidatus Bathyarchaeota archaeon]|nr:hypothetical protein [Candidatus Bathyarchaeota archaeon]
MPKRSDIKIKHCFWYKEGACTSPEQYRFLRPEDTPEVCSYPKEATAFVEPEQRLRCPEFRHEH